MMDLKKMELKFKAWVEVFCRPTGKPDGSQRLLDFFLVQK